jgi:hypothetical protein
MYEQRCKTVLGKEVNSRVKRSVGGCVFCEVPLCKGGTARSDFILMMLITSNILCNMHGSDAT